MNINIRKAKPEDSKRMAHVHRISVRKVCSKFYEEDIIKSWSNISAQGVKKSILNPQINNLVAEVNGIIVGVAASEENNIWLLYIHPSYLGNRVGEKLLKRLEIDMNKKQIKNINLTSTLNAYNFYLRNGYVKVKKTTIRFRDGTQVPSIIMKKAINQVD